MLVVLLGHTLSKARKIGFKGIITYLLYMARNLSIKLTSFYINTTIDPPVFAQLALMWVIIVTLIMNNIEEVWMVSFRTS